MSLQFFKPVIRSSAWAGSLGLLSYLTVNRCVNQRMQLEREHPGKSVDIKFHYIPGVGPYYSLEMKDKQSLENSTPNARL